MSQVYSDAQIVKANGAEFFYIYYKDGRIGQGCHEMCVAVKEGKMEDYLRKCRQEREYLGIGREREVKTKVAAKVKPQKPVQLSLF